MKWKAPLGALAAAFGLLAVVVGVKTATVASRQIAAPAVTKPSLDAQAMAKRLSRAVTFKTISEQDPSTQDFAPFDALSGYLETSFPKTHAACQREKVNTYSLLYTCVGTDAALPPIVLLAHQDVVPAEAATLEQWTHPPFSGAIADGFVWGRGTLDDKMSVMGLLEAMEFVLANGMPKRTIIFAFGHDEEVAGHHGARLLADTLAKRGVKPWFVVDEGSIIAEGIVPALDRPVALMGIAEKGYVTLTVTAKAEGGHSSMPPARTAAGRLASAIVLIEANPMPASLDGVLAKQFDYLGPEMKLGMKLPLANRWLLGSVIQSILEKKVTTNAQLRTTTAVTMLSGSPKENVLASRASAAVNFRIRPGDTMESVAAHVRALVGAPDVEITVRPGGGDPAPVSPAEGAAFDFMHRTIRASFPDVVFAPGLVIAMTDSRHYAKLTPNIYRFVPLRMGSADLKRIHGINERIRIENYAEVVAFYVNIITEAAGER